MKQNTKGAIFMIICMLAYSINDALIKLAGINLPIFEAIFIRGLFTIFFLINLGFYRNELFIKINKKEIKLIFVRVLGDVGTTLAFIFAIFNMQLANATAILLTLPLGISLASAFLFGEKIGLIRWIVILLGFLGVILIIKPSSEGFNYYSIAAIIAVLFIILRDLSTHQINKQIPSVYISLMTAIAVTFAAGVLIPTHGWEKPSFELIFILFLASVFLTIGIIFSVEAIRNGEINFSAPFRYSIIIFAIIFGIILFKEVPDIFSLIGCTIIVVTGIYMLKSKQI